MEFFYIIIFLEIFIYIIYKKSSLLLSKNDLFPKITKELIDKFNSFDIELGWVNKKNTIKKEVSQGKEITYTYNQLGARSIGDIDLKDSNISTYGDSYCLSREVPDNNTWQYFLSHKLNTNVSNFGVGNYGLDQSLLRLKKEYKYNPTKTVIMAITPYTITRISSVWKHFSEFQNILAVKPRFIINDNKLKLIKNILLTKDDLINMKDKKEFLYKYDEHIEYFNQHIYKFPFILSAILKPKPLIRTISAKLIGLCKRANFNKLSLWFLEKYFISEIKYRKDLFRKNKVLIELLIKDYVDFAKQNNFTPILLILPSIEDVRYYIKTKDKYYFPNINKIKNIKTLDFMDSLLNNKPGDYYVDSNWGGHYNTLGNKELAKFLEGHLNEKN